MPGTAQPYLAVLVVFRKDNKVAFLLRKNTGWMDGNYGFPGGKVEQGETFVKAAIREAKEEVGAVIQPENLKYLLTGRLHSLDGSDWLNIVFEAIGWEFELVNKEPELHAELAWLDMDSLPDNIIPETRHYIEQITIKNAFTEFGWDNT